MAGTVDELLELITSEHRRALRYLETVGKSVAPIVNAENLLDTIPGLFDIDVAIASRLDTVGVWVGKSRNIDVPLSVYFCLDTEGLGLDEGYLYSPFDPLTGIVTLEDYWYRLLLFSTILSNHWDGTKESAYIAWDLLFSFTGQKILIIDLPYSNQFFQLDVATHGLDSGAIMWSGQRHGVMTMSLAIFGPQLDAVTLSMFMNGILDLKPVAVEMVDHIAQSVIGIPFFGLDYETTTIDGLDIGAWGLYNEYIVPSSDIPLDLPLSMVYWLLLL